jgi:hypothetical protein
MAYSIGPKFTNAIDGNNLATIYLEGDKTIDERNRKDWDQSLAGIKALGSGVGKVRQWMAAEELKKQLKDKIASLQSARDAANEELLGLKNDQTTASNRQYGLEQQILAQRNLPTDADLASMIQAYGSIDKDYQMPTEDTYSVPMQSFYRPGRRSGL